jgi:hypothetical protein
MKSRGDEHTTIGSPSKFKSIGSTFKTPNKKEKAPVDSAFDFS